MNVPIDYQHLFTSLLEAFPLPVLVVNNTLAICYYNQSALRLFEKTPPLQDMPLDALLHDQTIMQLVRASIQTGRSSKAEFARGNADGTWSISVTPLADQNAQTNPAYSYFAITIEDKATLRHLERMQRDFIANVSHELRTPLSSIRLLTETLEDAIDTDHEKAQEFVEKN